MKKLTLLICVLAILLSLTGPASASRPELEPFTTTGYTTFYEGEMLPSGHARFHLTAQGLGEDRCVPFDEPCCGVSGYFEGGTFSFEEWGIVDFNTGQGVNYGILTVTTDDGEAQIRFDGQSHPATDTNPATVQGSFTALNGTDEYKGLKGQGTFDGDAELTFTVDYTPCGKKDGTPCPACAASGEDLKLKKKQAKWKLTNNGDDTITISSITVWWPDTTGKLKKVKLGGKTIYDKRLDAPWATINSDWKGKDKDRQIGKGKTKELKFEFQHKGSTLPSDYTILVEFAEGCAACAVEFTP